MRIHLAFAVALVLLPAAAGAQRAPAPAPPICGPLATITANLQREFGETLAAAGAEDKGALMQTFANERTGSWTIAMTLPGGPTCIVAMGEGYTRDPARSWTAWFFDVAAAIWGRP